MLVAISRHESKILRGPFANAVLPYPPQRLAIANHGLFSSLVALTLLITPDNNRFLPERNN